MIGADTWLLLRRAVDGGRDSLGERTVTYADPIRFRGNLYLRGHRELRGDTYATVEDCIARAPHTLPVTHKDQIIDEATGDVYEVVVAERRRLPWGAPLDFELYLERVAA